MIIDVSLTDVDINQCDAQDSSDSTRKSGTEHRNLNTFMGTHHCKISTKVSSETKTNMEVEEMEEGAMHR